MKVKDVVLMLSCLDGDLDLRIQDQDGAPTILCESSEDKQPVLVIHPVSGNYETFGMLGMMIGMSFSARDREEQCTECTPYASEGAREYCQLHKKWVGGSLTTPCIERTPTQEPVFRSVIVEGGLDA